MLKNTNKTPAQLVWLFSLLFIGLTAVAVIDTAVADEAGTLAESISYSPTDTSLTAVLSDTAVAATEYTSPTFTAAFPFNGLGLQWTGPADSQVLFYVKVDDGDWVNLPMMEHEAKDKAETYISHPVFLSGTQLQYKISGPDVAYVRNVTITYFDSTRPPQTSLLRSLSSTIRSTLSSTDSTIVSRADWGADESYRSWATDYTTPEKFIIHHTAGGSGDDDPAAVVRGIYYWHAIVLGWGDIGYNYLVDQTGTIYEGRYGGDGAVGAHAYNSRTDTNYNEYSIGIAILGCFEDTETACATVQTTSTDMIAGLTDLIATQANTFGINPTGSGPFFDLETKNIIGHNDVDSTYCPGNHLTEEFKTIRQQARDKYVTLIGQQSYAATVVDQVMPSRYVVGDVTPASLTFQNVGQHTWSAETVALQVNVKKTGQHQRVVIPDEVANTNITTVSWDWTTLLTKPGTFTVTTRLYRSGKIIRGSKRQFTITVSTPYQGKVLRHTLPVALLAGWQPAVSLTVHNTGSATWNPTTRLLLNGQTVSELGQAIEPGKKKVLSFTLPVTDWSPGSYTLKITLQDGDEIIHGVRVVQTIRID